MSRSYLFVLLVVVLLPAAAEAVALQWLEKSVPTVDEGVSFGVPWPQGAVSRQTQFTLTDAKGLGVPLQTWPLAYWPDGSLKWTGHAAASADLGAANLTIGPPSAPAASLTVDQNDSAITISAGTLTCRIPKSGPYIIDSIALAGRVVANHGELICTLEDRSQYAAQKIIRQEDFTSQIESAIVEQSGPVRAVVKITGRHASEGRSWLPFVVRLYFYAGVSSIKMVHTFIFDGDQDKDFIRALGVRFGVPLREEYQNRHVRLSGDEGFFAEPVQLISGRRNPTPDFYRDQTAGKRIPNLRDLPGGQLVADMAVWDAYKLVQISDGSYSIQKRTNPQSAWINAAAGRRSAGLAFVGDVSGGLAVSLQNFWQLEPTEFEIDGASTGEAQLTLWLWSVDSPAMDLRHYDIKAHGLEASYEDVQPGFSTATGVARTSVLTIRPYSSVPSDEDLWKAAQAGQRTPLLVCSPRYYHSIPVFGLWSLPDRSAPRKAWIEDELDKAISFYQGQIEQRHWFGFWDFGDVMHTYDATRHEWKYDVGGFAWDDTELMPNLWLWYTFMRSGRPDVFAMAEAMTRQSQEVDVYHLGRFAGLGSRHNVRHWGDGAKEVRISQSLLKRFYYYLTTDERTGDLMNEVINVDQKLVDVDPLREIDPKTQYPTHIRTGPDWFACVSNWYTAWERTGDTKYRDWIVTGMKCYAAMPHGLFSTDSNGGYGYDPTTHKIYPVFNQVGNVGFTTLFGGGELNFEIDPVMNVPEWDKVWLRYCEYLSAPDAEQIKVIGGRVNTGRSADFARLPAYAAYVKKDPALAARAWQMFLHAGGSGGNGTSMGADPFGSHKVDGPVVPSQIDEIRSASTNSTSQWCLNAIELLEMVGDQIPAK
jgi:YetA-like protein